MSVALPELHKNSGRLSFDWNFWRLYLTVSVAEDPKKPLLLRTWARQRDEGMHQTEMLFEFARITCEFDDGTRQKAWKIIIGPFCLWLALMNTPGK